jgi:hypothetical protein
MWIDAAADWGPLGGATLVGVIATNPICFPRGIKHVGASRVFEKSHDLVLATARPPWWGWAIVARTKNIVCCLGPTQAGPLPAIFGPGLTCLRLLQSSGPNLDDNQCRVPIAANWRAIF